MITQRCQIAAKIKPDSETPAPVQVGQKRPLEEDFEGPADKRQSLEMATAVTSEQVMVPDKMVGLIIGKGGEQITRLQAETGCKIQMAADSGGLPERLCTLTGTMQAIAQAKLMVEGIIANEGAGGGRGGMPMGGGGGPPGGGGQFEMMIPGNKVGLVIGKGGETIKLLQEQTGAKMIIIQESNQQANEKPLRISGPPDSVERAKAEVFKILNQNDRNGGGGVGGGRGGYGGGGMGRGRGGGGGAGWPSAGPGDKVECVMVASNKVGLVIGKGGETIKSINQASGAHVEIDRNAPPDAQEKNFLIKGSAEAVERAKSMVLEKIGAIEVFVLVISLLSSLYLFVSPRDRVTELSQGRHSSPTEAVEEDEEVTTMVEVTITVEEVEAEVPPSLEVQPSTPPRASPTTAPSGPSTTGASAWGRRRR